MQNERENRENVKPFFPLQKSVMAVGGGLTRRLSGVSRREDAAVLTALNQTEVTVLLLWYDVIFESYFASSSKDILLYCLDFEHV